MKVAMGTNGLIASQDVGLGYWYWIYARTLDSVSTLALVIHNVY